jgi:cell division GTPase FtsZ
MIKIVVIGVGGAGCYLANQIQSKISCNSLAIDRIPHLLDDYNFANKIEISAQDYNGDVLDALYKNTLLQDVQKHLRNSSILVLAIGLGGYIGTTLGVELAKLARSMEIKIICVAYKPFAFEIPRHKTSLNALEELRVFVNELIVHDHSVRLPVADQSQSMRHYFVTAGESMTNEVVRKLVA